MKQVNSSLPEIRVSYVREQQPVTKISTADNAYRVLMNIYDTDTLDLQEYSYVLFLNRSNMVLGWYLLSKGGMCGTVIDVKILFSVALSCGACGMIISHNHPSGNLQPSDQDIQLTRKIKEVGNLLDIVLLDHIIVTRNGYYSFADEGRL